jgi:hypothetical protein
MLLSAKIRMKCHEGARCWTLFRNAVQFDGEAKRR